MPASMYAYQPETGPSSVLQIQYAIGESDAEYILEMQKSMGYETERFSLKLENSILLRRREEE